MGASRPWLGAQNTIQQARPLPSLLIPHQTSAQIIKQRWIRIRRGDEGHKTWRGKAEEERGEMGCEERTVRVEQRCGK